MNRGSKGGQKEVIWGSSGGQFWGTSGGVLNPCSTDIYVFRGSLVVQ